MSDFFADLESELRRATVRRAAAARAARVSNWRRAPIAAAVAAAVLLALSGALLLSPLRGGDGGQTPLSPPQAPAPARIEQQVDKATRAAFGVMRRPQRAGERDRTALTLAAAVLPKSLGDPAPTPTNEAFGGATVLLPSMRAVDVGGRARMMLVPIRPARDDPRAVDGDRIVVALGLGRPGRSDMVVSRVGVTPPLEWLVGAGYSALVSDRDHTVFATLVPDSVTRVEVRLPAVAARAGRPALAAAVRTARIHENVAAVSVRRLASETHRMVETQYDAHGRSVARIIHDSP